MGSAATLTSGANEAWIVDLLKHHRKKELIKEYYTKTQSFSGIGFFMGGFMGAFLVGKFKLGIIWPISGVAGIIAGLILLFAKEHFIKRKSHIKKKIGEIFSHTRKSIKFALAHKEISLIILASISALFAAGFSGNVIWFSFLKQTGFKDAWFGYLSSFTALLSIGVALIATLILRKIKSYKKYLILILLLEGVVLIAMYFAKNLIIFLAVFAFVYSLNILFTIGRQPFFQEFIPNKMRATITSFREMLIALVTVFSIPFGGWVADQIGLQNTLVIGGLLVIPTIIIYSKIKEKS